MTVKALVGASGTGKSYRAVWLAGENGLDYIIDDGILICRNKIIEGSSAKKAKTKVGAIKRAIFEDLDLRNNMKSAIKRSGANGILILATSDKMAELIRERLSLPPFEEIINIEDISTKEEIERAKLMREVQGKHVIPVPVMEIRKTFSGYFLDPLSVFRKSQQNSTDDVQTIVRPSYSYIGDFEINDTVLSDIARYELSKFSEICEVFKSAVEKTDSGAVFNMELSVFYGVNIPKVANKAALRIKSTIEQYTSVYTEAVNITVKAVEKCKKLQQ